MRASLHFTGNCRFEDLHPSMLIALDVMLDIYGQFGVEELWLTSADDGRHNPGSLHPKGRALDIRVFNIIVVPTRQKIADEAEKRLSPQFDVLYGAAVNHLDHIHIEYDPN